MRIPDRYWWLQRAAGIVLAVLVVAFAVWFATDSILRSGDNTSLGFALFLLVGFILFTIRESFRSQDRYRRRLAALHGDLDAIPLANIAVHADSAPTVAAEPLELMWHATRLSRRVFSILYAITYILFGGFRLVILLATLYGVYLLATTKPIQPFTFDFTTVVIAAVVAVLVITVLIEIPLVIGTIGRYWTTDVRGRPYGLSGDSEGIMDYPRLGRRRLIRWDEIRLLEVTTRNRSSKEERSYRLYGRDAIVQWYDAPPSAWVMVGTMGMTSEEYAARHQALLDLITARTSLTPRTFDAARRGRGNR